MNDIEIYQEIKNYLTAVKAASYHEIQEGTKLNDDEMELGISIGLKAKGIESYKLNGYLKYRVPSKVHTTFNPSPVSYIKKQRSYFKRVDLIVANALVENPTIKFDDLLALVRRTHPLTTRKVVKVARDIARRS